LIICLPGFLELVACGYCCSFLGSIFFPHLKQKIEPAGFSAPQFVHSVGVLFTDCCMFCPAVWNASWISLAAIAKAFSISVLILANACRISSDGVGALVSTPLAVLTPHFGQKLSSFEIFSPQLAQ